MSDPDDLRAAMVQQLQSLRRSGVTDLPRGRIAEVSLSPSVVAPAPPPAAESTAVAEPVAEPAEARSLFDETHAVPILSRDDRVRALEVLRHEVAACTRCADLVRSRSRTVFGVGNPQPRVCFFGEGPGADEDAQGEPFVGRAGQLLNKIIAASKMTREEVYILNAVKCRPENNRTPSDEEIEHCWGFARRQIDILQPEFICCLGGVAVRSLLKRQDSVGRLRGRFHRYGASQVLVTYHPAYLLRNPAAKRDVWDDMQMLMKAMGIPIP